MTLKIIDNQYGHLS